MVGVKGPPGWPLPSRSLCEAAAGAQGWASEKQLPGLGAAKNAGLTGEVWLVTLN